MGLINKKNSQTFFKIFIHEHKMDCLVSHIIFIFSSFLSTGPSIKFNSSRRVEDDISHGSWTTKNPT